MSWRNPFKKAFSGRRTRSEDVEFEREVNKLRQTQAVSKRMYKDMKRCNEVESVYLNSIRSLVLDVKSSTWSRIEPLKYMAEVLGSIMMSLHGHSKEVRTNQDTLFVHPIKKLNSVYKQVELHIKQREQKLQDYERQQVRVDKQCQKTSGLVQSQQQSRDQSLSQRAVMAARTDYERVHDRMMVEIPQLLEGGISYVDHCLCAVTKAQALYYQQCCVSLLTGLKSLQNTYKDWSEEAIQQTTTSHLDSIKSLSIVGNVSTQLT